MLSPRTRGLSLVVFTAVALAACADGPTIPAIDDVEGPAFALGNGYPSGGHDYSLQIIGVPKNKSASMDNNNGHRIFVQLWSDNTVTNPGGKNNQLAKGGDDDQNHIYLCNSTNGENDVVDPRCDAWRALGHVGDYGVIDANGTDGDGAMFGLPDPCAGTSSTDGCTPTYAIWARAKTGGSATITTCADETGAGYDGSDDVWCGSNGITLSRQTAKKAIDVSSSLLYMTITVDDTFDPQLAFCIDPDGDATDGLPDSYNIYLFDRCFENYFWNYDNNGLKVLELRFFSAN
jgi:hypothetical protein